MTESGTAAILTDHQTCAEAWSILLPEATCLILYQVTCQKRETAVLSLALFLSKIYL